MDKEKIRDNLFNANVKEVSNCVMAVANGMQNYKNHIQLLSLAYGFITWCKITKQNPQDVFLAIDNISKYHGGIRPEFLAVENYLKKEVISNVENIK